MQAIKAAQYFIALNMNRRTRSIFHCFEWIHGVLNAISRIQNQICSLVFANSMAWILVLRVIFIRLLH